PHFKRRHPLRAATEVRLMRLFGGAMERASWTTCRHAGAWLGLLFWHAARQRSEIATENVRLAFPDLGAAACRRLARRSAQNFAMTFCEFLHLRTASPEEIREYAWIEGMEHVEAGLARGHG